jgi:(p)ppGpp synthase/HD superfamily hydrolase
VKIYDVNLRVRTDDHVGPELVKAKLTQSSQDRRFNVSVTDIEPGHLTVEEVDSLAAFIHEGQTDKGGTPYVEHVRAVAAGLKAFGPLLVMAGLLHDSIEDGEGWSAEQLLTAGVIPSAVELVEMVTNTPGEPYQVKMKRITQDYLATLLKISDNAHNSREDRRKALDQATRDRHAKKYSKARETLWAAVKPEDVETILKAVNPGLLPELYKMHPNLSEEITC